MKWAIIILLVSAAAVDVRADPKAELADRIVDDLCSMWSEADIPAKYSFLVWPAYKEISNPANWPRLELIRDVSTVGDLVAVWPSPQALRAAVYANLPARAVNEFVQMMRLRELLAARSAPPPDAPADHPAMRP